MFLKPLQDLEIFARSYIYQIGLQAGVSVLAIMRDNVDKNDVGMLIKSWLGTACFPGELYFILDSISTVLQVHDDVESYRRFLRMPVILAEPAFVSDLRRGGGFRALRRVWVLAQLNSFVENILDEILMNLGHEELGKRGCANGDLSGLDVDLKARFVTTEELTLSIGTRFCELVGTNPPAVSWLSGAFLVGMKSRFVFLLIRFLFCVALLGPGMRRGPYSRYFHTWSWKLQGNGF